MKLEQKKVLKGMYWGIKTLIIVGFARWIYQLLPTIRTLLEAFTTLLTENSSTMTPEFQLIITLVGLFMIVYVVNVAGALMSKLEKMLFERWVK